MSLASEFANDWLSSIGAKRRASGSVGLYLAAGAVCNNTNLRAFLQDDETNPTPVTCRQALFLLNLCVDRVGVSLPGWLLGVAWLQFATDGSSL